MKITILGSSHGVPEAHRRCSCTMLEVAGRYYFIDMGSQAIEELVTRGIDIDAVKGIFITHMHGDHTNGLVSFIDLISWYFKTADPEVYLPKLAAVDPLRSWLKVNGSGERDIRFREVAEGVIFDDGYLKVTAIRTQHCDVSYAYLVEADGKAVLFTGDLAGPGKDFPAIAFERELELIVCEAAHFPAGEYASVLSGCRVKRVCVTHYQPKRVCEIFGLADALEGVSVFAASDGIEL